MSVDQDGSIRTEIRVGGMTCGACTSAIEAAMADVAGVESVAVSLVTNSAVVVHENSVSVEELLETIEDVGFEANLISSSSSSASALRNGSGATELDTASLLIHGMTCAACSTAVDSALLAVPGIKKASANCATGYATIVFDPNVTGIRSAISAVEDAGFDALAANSLDTAIQVQSLKRVSELAAYRNQFLLSALLGIPVFVLIKLRDGGVLKQDQGIIVSGVHYDDLVCLVLASLLQFVVGKRFYIKAVKAARTNSLNMDVLIAISTTAAYLYSLVALGMAVCSGKPQKYLYDASAMIMTFVLFGKYLETMALGRTSQQLSSLISMVPTVARLLEPGSTSDYREVSTELLQRGDTILLWPGEKVPADGVILSGETDVNEAMLTGESDLVHKKRGSEVTGGTINLTGSPIVRVERCGNSTRLAETVKFIREAQAIKAPIQNFADYYVSRFVHGILILAFVTFVGWIVISSCIDPLPMVFKENARVFVCFKLCITVVVVACPCALGLATPTAIMVASGVSAKNGILARSGAAFESLSHVDLVLFDKTGTITSGELTVSALRVPQEYRAAVAEVEARSEHPVAKALANYLCPSTEGSDCTVVDFEAVAGRGVRATVKVNGNSLEIFAGSRKFLESNNCSGLETMVRGAQAELYKNQSLGRAPSMVYIAVNNTAVGWAAMIDEPREGAKAVVETLIHQGYTVGLISGDGREAVQSIASLVGIDPEFVWSEITPEGKMEVVRQLQSAGKIVAMVGDGINDSPALATADVGLSLEGATHLAVEAADIVLLGSNPVSAVPAALDLGKTTLQRIKFNMFSSVIYNVLMLPIAMGALLPFGIMLSPVLASAAMALSSVSVILSSLLLTRWTPDHHNATTGLYALPQFLKKMLGGGAKREYVPLSTV